MKRVLSLFIVLVCASMLYSCSKSASGTYQREGSSKDYMELKSDGTFFVKQRGSSFSGKYTVEGNTITLTLPSGMADRVKIENNKIIEDNGHVWVKK